MIPRHQPGYTWGQWLSARRDRRPLAELEAELGEKLCRRLRRRHAVFYLRGRDAFYAYFHRIATGRPAIVPAFTCYVVPEAIRNAGSPISFADVDEATLNMELENLVGLEPPAGTVLIMTHQFGLPCRTAAIVNWARAHEMTILEDCAGALGAEIDGRPCGSFGDVAILSFENTKLLGSGAIGVLLTDDDDVAARLRDDQADFAPPDPSVIRMTALLKMINTNAIYRPIFGLWSWRNGDRFSGHGAQHTIDPAYYRCRPHPFALALALQQWHDLDRRIEHRRRLLALYREALGDTATCQVNPGAVPSPIRQPIRVEHKRAFYEAMYRAGVDLGWSFAYTVVPADRETDFPHARLIGQHILNLPIHEGVDEATAQIIARRARKAQATLTP